MTFFKYVEIAKVSVQTTIRYIHDMLANSLFLIFILFSFIILWKVVYTERPIIEGFSLSMLLWYFIMAEAITTSKQKLIRKIGEDVQTGKIANQLNKPYNYLIYEYFAAMGTSLVQFTFTLAIGIILLFFLSSGIPFTLISLPFVAISIILAISINVLLGIFVGIFTFVLEEHRGIDFLFNKLIFLLGGMFMPLEFFPTWIVKISNLLPFSYVAYHTSKLFVVFNFDTFFKVIGMQILWILIIACIMTLTFNYFVRKVSINGG